MDGPISSPAIEDPTPKDETRTRARAPRRARALGPGALGPEGLGPWALGPLALGAWARARGVPTAPLPGARGPASLPEEQACGSRGELARRDIPASPRAGGQGQEGPARARPWQPLARAGQARGARLEAGARARAGQARGELPREALPAPRPRGQGLWRAPARGPGSPSPARDRPGARARAGQAWGARASPWSELPRAGQACQPPARARTGRGARLEALPAPRVLPVPRVREARRGWWQPDAPRAAGELLCFPHFSMIMESFPHGIIPVKSIIFL